MKHAKFAATLFKRFHNLRESNVAQRLGVQILRVLEAVTIHAVCPTVGRWTGGRHATELVLAGELATELGEMGNEVLAHLHHRLLGGDLAVGLDADEKLRHVRVGNLFWGANVSAKAC